MKLGFLLPDQGVGFWITTVPELVELADMAVERVGEGRLVTGTAFGP